jgi:hypothetical protein
VLLRRGLLAEHAHPTAASFDPRSRDVDSGGKFRALIREKSGERRQISGLQRIQLPAFLTGDLLPQRISEWSRVGLPVFCGSP